MSVKNCLRIVLHLLALCYRLWCIMKNEQIFTRVGPIEKKLLKKTQKATGLSQAEIIRQCVRAYAPKLAEALQSANQR